MTPMAQMIMRLSMDPRARSGAPRMVKQFYNGDIHCFEVTEVAELAGELFSADKIMLAAEQLCFLPAPKTWIEYRCAFDTPPARRVGYLIEEAQDQTAIVTYAMLCADGDIRCQEQSFRLPLINHPAVGCVCPELGSTIFDKQVISHHGFEVVAFLAMINTPKVIGRRQHMPHAGLQRAIARSHGMAGKFPLRAWTEIKLEVGLPRSDGELHEARLSGHKALHFCRAHLRVRRGRVEFVTAHWRGDPALGIKRSRYRLSLGTQQ